MFESTKIRQERNIQAAAEKELKNENENIWERSNRNTKREGSARQNETIPLLSWGPPFSCHSKLCAYQQCEECGIKKFFSEPNLCKIERNVDMKF